MTRILLVDDSPHAQRMGERILSDEGYEVVTVSNADSALIRMDDVDPDVVIADTVMPGRSGYEICQYLKMSPRHKHVRVILTAGVLEPLDEDQVRRSAADGTLKKPFEATGLLAAVRPLADAAAADRSANAPAAAPTVSGSKAVGAPFIAVIDAEQIRAAVTVALDASMAAMVEEITARVVAALNTKKSDAAAPPEANPATLHEEPSAPPPPSRLDAVRRISPVRPRSGSILGLDIGRRESEEFLVPPRQPSE